MFRLFFLLMLSVVFSGCSTYQMVHDYNQGFTDYTGNGRVAIAFDTHEQTRIYPETGECIDLYSKNNGFLSKTQDNSINYPDLSGLKRKFSSVHWVSSNKNIAIRIIYTGNKKGSNAFNSGARVAESFIVFKPEPDAFYYVTDDDMDFQNSDTGKYLKIYKVIDNGSGTKKLEHVKMLNVNNCPGQKKWYNSMGAVI